MARTRPVLDLAIRLDPGPRGQARQLHAALRAAILDGRLPAGTKLPSSRSLADQLRINRNSVVAAFEQLAGDGFIDSQPGAGTFVVDGLPAPMAEKNLPEDFTPPPRRPFGLGYASTDDALLRRLAGHLRRRVLTAQMADLDYGDPRGSLHLRREIAQYLATQRGILCDPGAILILGGTQPGIRLCADALLTPGAAVWVEDPGYDATCTTLTAAGLELVPVPVDAEGLDVAAGLQARPNARAAFVTPSHQFPSGVVLSLRRRLALVAWARSVDGWIIEDDYDSEFRYAGPPLTALAGIAAERVIYLGSFTKTLFAGLRLAYLVAPPALVPRLIAARAALDRFPPSFTQDAVADLMAEGYWHNHTRRMRRHYRIAGERVVSILRACAGPALRVEMPAQGLHLLAMLPDGVSADQAELIRRRADVDAMLLSQARQRAGGPEGFVLGFSGHGLADLEQAAQRLGRAARDTIG